MSVFWNIEPTRAQLRESSLASLSIVVTVDAEGTSHLAATLPQEIPRNVPRFMTDSIAVLEDNYGYNEVNEVNEVIVNVYMTLELKWQLFSPM